MTPEVRILKSGACPSLSGKSRLTYEVGGTGENEIAVRITDNTGGGFYSREWLPLATIEKVVHGAAKKGLSSMSFRGAFSGKSVNTAGFLLAVLKAEGAIRLQPDKTRLYEVADFEGFVADLRARMRDVSETQAKTGGRPGAPAKKAIRKAPAKAR